MHMVRWVHWEGQLVAQGGSSHVKSPVASLCLICSSVRNRVRVTMFVLIFSIMGGVASPPFPLVVVILRERKFGRASG